MNLGALTLVISLAAPLTDVEPRNEAAELAYREGRFEAAATHYRALLGSLPQTRLLFNLGNCAFRQGEHAEAALLFRRVLLRRPGDHEARFNLRLAERRLGLEDAPASNVADRVTAWLDEFPVAGALLAGLAQLIGLVGLIVFRRPVARAACAALLACGFAATLRGATAGGDRESRDAVVLEAGLALRTAPHVEASTVIGLRAGEVVRVVESSDRWARVGGARGAGWIELGGVGRVE